MVMETRRHTKYDDLQKKLDIFKQCKENLSKEDLQGRYNKAYRQLKTEISELLKEMVLAELQKIHFSKHNVLSHQKEINDCFEIFRIRILESARTQFSVDAIMDIWGEFQLKMMNEYGAIIDVSDILKDD